MDVVPFAAVAPSDAVRLGGKGHSLGLLAAAGLPVPDGLLRRDRRLPPAARPAPDAGLRDAIVAAYRHLGGGAGRGALVGHRRGRRGRPASPASRKRSSASKGTTRVVEAVAEVLGVARHRPGGRLPPQAGGGRRRAGDGRRRADARRRGGGRRAVHARPARPDGHAHARRGVVGAGRGRRVRPGDARRFQRRPRHRRGPRPARRRQDRSRSRAAGEEAVPPERRRASCLYGRPARRNWPSWAGGSRRITATRATSNGPWPAARFWLLQARPITAATAAERERGPPRGDRRPRGTVAEPAAPSGAGSTSSRSCPSRRR